MQKINKSAHKHKAPEIQNEWLTRNFEGGGNVSASSYFIANAHNELYAFYTGRDDLLTKILRPIGGRPPPLPPPLNLPRWLVTAKTFEFTELAFQRRLTDKNSGAIRKGAPPPLPLNPPLVGTVVHLSPVSGLRLKLVSHIRNKILKMLKPRETFRGCFMLIRVALHVFCGGRAIVFARAVRYASAKNSGTERNRTKTTQHRTCDSPSAGC